MVKVPDGESDCFRRGEAEVRLFNFKTTCSEFQVPRQTAPNRGEVEERVVNFKTTWSEFQIPSQNTPAGGSRGTYIQIQNHMGQSFITSPELVQSSCVR